MLTILAFIVLLGVLITVHEAGHFVVAKLTGVAVEVFSIGFGKPIVKFTRGETEYRIAWIPLGGYVRMVGMLPGELGEGQVVPTEQVNPAFEGRGLLDKPPLIRIAIMAAGPVMNLILPFLILPPFFALSERYAEVPSNRVGAVDEGLPAYKAGMREGDAIVAINGEPVHAFWQVKKHIDGYDAEQGRLTVTLQRDGVDAPLELEVTPERIEQTNRLLNFKEAYYRIGYQQVFLGADVAVIDPQSPVARAGLKTFDRVLSVGGQETPRYMDVLRALEAAAAGQPVPVTVERDVYFDPERPFLARRDAHTFDVVPQAGAPLGLRHAGGCVTSVDPEGPAARALRVGDCIVAVDGARNSLAAFIHSRLAHAPELPKEVIVLRDGQEQTVTFQAQKEVLEDPLAGEVTRFRLGFVLLNRRSSVPMETVPDQDRLASAWFRTTSQVSAELELTLRTITGMFSGAVSPTQLSGPVTIFYLAGEHAKAGLDQFIHLMVLLSLSVALFNLLPVPLLDGGQILVAFIELVTRRPLPISVQVGLQRVGVFLILSLVLFALGNDVVRMWRISGAG